MEKKEEEEDKKEKEKKEKKEKGKKTGGEEIQEVKERREGGEERGTSEGRGRRRLPMYLSAEEWVPKKCDIFTEWEVNSRSHE